jgi:hypothetical protein
MLKKLAFLSFVATLGSSVHAANILGTNFASDFSAFRPFVANNAPMPNNSGVVQIGSFGSLTDPQIQAMAAANDRAGLIAAFTQFASSTVVGGPNAFDVPGLYKADFSAPLNTGNPLIGDNIYTFVGNQSTLAGSNQILIMKADPAVLFPEDNPVGVAEANLTDVDAAIIVGTAVPGVTLPGVAGTFSGAGLVPIPEPTALLTCLLGVIGMAMRRRRS